jgi:hypothetical protein
MLRVLVLLEVVVEGSHGLAVMDVSWHVQT